MSTTSWLRGFVADFVSNRLKNKNLSKGGRNPWLASHDHLEGLENRTLLTSFTGGNIAVLDLAAASNNTTGSILELNPGTANQSSPVQTVGVPATGSNALRFSDSGTSGFLSDSNDRTLLTFSAYNTTDATDSDLATVTPLDPASDRAVGTLDNGTNVSLPTTYTGTSTNQARSATSTDDFNFFITDKGGLYTNGATSANLTTNILDTRSFGGTVYVSSTKTTDAVSTVSSPTASTLTGLTGVPTDGTIQDFYLIQSGTHGSTYDILYTLDQNATKTGAATINKFSLVGSTWTANGSYSLAGNATAMIAANNGAGGAFLYVVTTAQAADNSLKELTDTAGFNATINVTTANNVTLYTATGTSTLKGIDFVPIAANVPTVTSPTKTGIGINSATLGGTLTVTGGEAITQRGIVYSTTNPNPTIGGNNSTPVAASGTSLGAFTVGVAGLQGTSSYYYAAYATSSAGTGYSSVDTFTTQSANPPAIDTPSTASITNSSATLGGAVESNGGAPITKTGVVFALTSADSNPHVGDGKATEVDSTSPVGSGAFTISASPLSAGASYTFEAFATNSSGTTYTAATQFNTLAAPTVNSPTFAAVTGNSANLGANVASDGGSPVTERGVVYALTSLDSNPQINDGTAIKVDASGTTGVFAAPVSGLSGSSSYTFEAFATNSIGTTYTPATSFTTADPGVITAWTFPALAGAGDNAPAPTYGTGAAMTLGMTNTYNGGNTAADDVVSTSGTANTGFTENTWRIRGTGHNGWATYQNGAGAPQYSQGAELDTSTVGYANIVFSFNWYSTTQGIRDLQVQYNTGSGWTNYQGPSPTGTFVSGGNDYYNSILSPVNPTIHVDLSGIATANNNPDLGIRLVSAFDSTGTLGNEYASAASTAGDIIPYNNSSGNWRFANLVFAAGITTSTAITANPPVGQSPGQNVTFTANVTPSNGAQYASGTVNFYDGTTPIGSSSTAQVGATNVGTASIALSTLAPGVHGDITAQYMPASANGLIASGSSMNLVAGDPTDNPISYTINAPQATGVDISPVACQAFTGAVATFSDGTYTNPAGFSASITWGDGHTSSGTIAFLSSQNETNINGQTVNVSLFTVTGTNTYDATGSYTLSVTITDPNSNIATVTPTARVAYAPLAVTAAGTLTTNLATSFTNQTVATFTDPGLVANLMALAITDPTTQFSASINWGDGTMASPDVTAGTITYSAGTFTVAGSHSYAATGSYSISVAVTPSTLSVERIDSSDPTNLNEVGDENANHLTDSPSADFIDQFVIGAANQTGPLYTTSLPSVATASGNEALTNSSYSVSEGELSLSTNGRYLVTGGYNDTVSLWAPQQTFSPASSINRVIGIIDGQGNINTTTDLTDAYNGDNFRGVVSTDGTQFWTSGHSTDSSDFVHYAQFGATNSTILTGGGGSNVNTVEIFDGQLYEGIRSTSDSAAGVFEVGNGLPTTAGQSQTLFIQVPQSDPLDITSSDKPMSPFGFYMTDLNDGNPTINGVNVAYVADAEMGIARYDYTNSGWQFSYYIDSTGSFKDNVYTVDGSGNVSPTASFDATNPIPASDPNADTSKAGGVKELTGRVVDGQVQLFAVTGFGTGSQPNPGGSLIEVTDTGANTGFTTLATNPTTDPSELTGVAFSPIVSVSTTASVNATPTSLSVEAASSTYGGTTTLAATLTNVTLGTGVASEGVTFEINGTPVASASTDSNGVASVSDFSIGTLDAGNASITAIFTGDSSNGASTGTNTLTVSQAPLTVTASANTKVYGATATDSGTVTGQQNGDSIIASFSSPGDSATADVNSYTISYSLSGTKLSDYDVTVFNPANLVVTAAPLTVTANANTKVYGATATGSGTITGQQNGDSISASFSSPGDSATADVSSYTISYSLSGAKLSDYSVSVFSPANLSVTAAPLTVTANSNTKVYGLTTTDSGTVTGQQNGDSITASFTSPGDGSTADVNSYPISYSLASAKLSDYSVTVFNPANLVVTAAPLTVTANANNKVYGSTATDGGTVTGQESGDSITASFTSAGDGAIADVNSYPISYSLSGTKLSDYSVTLFNPANLVVTAAPLAVTANANTKVYGTTATDTGTVTGQKNGDSITAGFTSAGDVATANVSSYPISYSLSGAKLSDYSVTVFNPANLVVTAAPLTVTATANTKVYGLTTTDSGTVTGQQNGDSITASFTSAGDGATANVNSYPITYSLSGAKLSDYSITVFNRANLVVTAAPLTVTATANTKVYGSTATDGGTVTGQKNGDSITASFTSAGDGATANVNSYPITYSLSGAKLSDYSVTVFNPANLVVTKDGTTSQVISSTGGSSTPGQSVTFTATVTAIAPGSGTPAGAIQFLVNGSVVYTTSLSSTTGQATYTTTALANGANTITVSYQGNTNYSASISGPITQNVGLNIGILLLDKTGNGALTDSGSGLVQVSNGSIDVNSSSSSAITVSGGAQVSASQTNDTGGDSLTGSGKIVGPLKTAAAAVGDPFAGLTAPDPSTLTVQSTSALSIGGNSTVTLYPGVYVGGINIGGSAKVTLSPGIYYLKGGGFTLGGAASVTDLGKGVLLYNAPAKSSDTINVGGSGRLTLSPITSSPYAGLCIFQDRTSTAALLFSGAAIVNLSGSVYAASSTLTISGSADLTITDGSSDPLSAMLVISDLNDSGAAIVSVTA